MIAKTFPYLAFGKLPNHKLFQFLQSVYGTRWIKTHNSGSVDLSAYSDDEPDMENYCPHAVYAIVENGAFSWSAQHIKVAYNYEKAASDAMIRGQSEWVHFLTMGHGL